MLESSEYKRNLNFYNVRAYVYSNNSVVRALWLFLQNGITRYARRRHVYNNIRMRNIIMVDEQTRFIATVVVKISMIVHY